MRQLQIPSSVALVLGIGMAVAGNRLPLHQNDFLNQTTGEFIAYVALTVGGVLIALIGAFGLGRASSR